VVLEFSETKGLSSTAIMALVIMYKDDGFGNF